ncbi:MAG: hypothetical protein QM820_28755 [Minicystis sp.]
MHSIGGSVFVLVAVFLSTGCSFVARTDAQQCSKDADCTARGPDFANDVCVASLCQPMADPTWACVGHVPNPSDEAMFTAQYQLIDVVSQAPVTNATVKLCNKLDPLCSMPLQMLPLSGSGAVSVTVAEKFSGYLDITAKDYLPTLYFIDTSVADDVINVTLLSPSIQASLNSSIGVEADPAAGSVNISMRDCTGERAAGVHFDIAPSNGEIGYYAIASAISRTATKTDSTGNGGYINVEAGTATLTATLASDGRRLGELTTLSRAGAITFQTLRPTPFL